MANRPHRIRRRSHRAGFIIFFGTRNMIGNEPHPPVQARCPACQRVAQLHGKKFRTWFTLYFIPVFPVSGATRFTQCSACGAQLNVPIDQLQQQIGDDQEQLNRKAIALYNSLRESPANSVTLNELMMLYGAMNDYPAAISAAGVYTQALHASPQCMTTLGRIYLAQGDRDQAIQWFDHAIARDPSSGEANHFKAAALLSSQPPRIQEALAAARQAVALGHAEAQALLNQAEAMSRPGT